MKLRFVTKKPKHKDYPKELKTLGDHLRKVRLDRGFSQPEVAKILGVVTDTVTCWELNRNTPTAKFAKKILEFIGYIPIDWFDAPTHMKLRYVRMITGNTQRQLAHQLKCDSTVVQKLEAALRIPNSYVRKLILETFN